MTQRKNSTYEMREIRKKIDLVDNKILPLMIKRSLLVSNALNLKTKKSEIVDTKRINQIKKKIANKSKKLGGDPKLMADIWMSIINNFIIFERKNFKK